MKNAARRILPLQLYNIFEIRGGCWLLAASSAPRNSCELLALSRTVMLLLLAHTSDGLSADHLLLATTRAKWLVLANSCSRFMGAHADHDTW